MVDSRGQGEHGPPRWRQEILLDVARQLGVVPDEFSEADWLERLRGLGDLKTQDRRNARLRRFWWDIDAYRHYVLLLSLAALFREVAVDSPSRIPLDIDPEIGPEERLLTRAATPRPQGRSRVVPVGSPGRQEVRRGRGHLRSHLARFVLNTRAA